MIVREHNLACHKFHGLYSPKSTKDRKAEYVQRRVRFVNVQSSLHEMLSFLFVRACAMLGMLYL